MVLPSLREFTRFTCVINAEQHQMATDLPTKTTGLSHWPACRRLWNYIHHRYLLLLIPKADTHFDIPL